MSDQIPLYIGIPLAMLCVAATVAVALFCLVMWRDSRG